MSSEMLISKLEKEFVFPFGVEGPLNSKLVTPVVK